MPHSGRDDSVWAEDQGGLYRRESALVHPFGAGCSARLVFPLAFYGITRRPGEQKVECRVVMALSRFGQRARDDRTGRSHSWYTPWRQLAQRAWWLPLACLGRYLPLQRRLLIHVHVGT